MNKTTYFCDICGNPMTAREKIIIPVRFHTEQDEGRAIKPHITKEKMDICDECLAKCVVLNGAGAQGINRYWIDKEATKDE